MRNRSFRLSAVCVVALLSWVSTAAAMYTPNPAGRWAAQRFFLAGDFQFIADKDLDPAGEIEDVAGFFVRPGYSLMRDFVVYGRLGFQTADHVDTGVAAGFGVQGAYVLPQAPAWAIGGSFDYLHWAGEISRTDRSIDWNEFQLAAAASYQPPTLPALNPYAGLLLNFVDGRGSVSEGDPIGLLFGASFEPAPQFRLDGQFRLISETGLFMSLAYLF